MHIVFGANIGEHFFVTKNDVHIIQYGRQAAITKETPFLYQWGAYQMFSNGGQ